MRRVRMTKDRLYFTERKRRRASGITKGVTGKLKSAEKKEGYAENGSPKLQLQLLGGGREKPQPQRKSGSPGDNSLAVLPTEEAHSSLKP
jgi:hypothetical protein